MPPKVYAYGPEKKCGRPRKNPKTAKEIAKEIANPTVAKKCGRPRKAPATPAQMERAIDLAYNAGVIGPVKKPRGRPPKPPVFGPANRRGRPRKAPATPAQMERAIDLAYRAGVKGPAKKPKMAAVVEKVAKVAKIPKVKAVKAVKAVLAAIPPPPPYTASMKAEIKAKKSPKMPVFGPANRRGRPSKPPVFGPANRRGRPAKTSAMTGMGGVMVKYEKKK